MRVFDANLGLRSGGRGGRAEDWNLQMSNSTEILDRETRSAAENRPPLRQWYSDAVMIVRRMLLIENGYPARRGSDGSATKFTQGRRSAKRRRRPAPAIPASLRAAEQGLNTQIQSTAMDVMISQIQSLTQKIEAAAQRVEEVSDKAEAAEQTALKMAELTALAATELAAFAATDQAKIIGFREAPRRRRAYGYSPNMDA